MNEKIMCRNSWFLICQIIECRFWDVRGLSISLAIFNLDQALYLPVSQLTYKVGVVLRRQMHDKTDGSVEDLREWPVKYEEVLVEIVLPEL